MTKLHRLARAIKLLLYPKAIGINLEKLFSDHAYFKNELSIHKKKVILALKSKYKFVNRDFIENYINHIINEHLNNPLATLYIESELGAPHRQQSLIEQLSSMGHTVQNKKCLDIGCNNGALALVCIKNKAADVVGVDVSEERLTRARQLCKDFPVRLKNQDIMKLPLEETFDVIFATDLLEHIPSPAELFKQIYRLLRDEETAFAYFSLFNKYFMNNIMTEPHYGIPGMILLPSDESRKLWLEIRGAYKSNLDYEVFSWFTFWEYQQMAQIEKLEVIPFINDQTIHSSIHLLTDYQKTATNFKINFKNRLDASSIPENYKKTINRQVDDYLEEFLREHGKLTNLQDNDKVRYLFMKYHAQPLMFIIKKIKR